MAKKRQNQSQQLTMFDMGSNDPPPMAASPGEPAPTSPPGSIPAAESIPAVGAMANPTTAVPAAQFQEPPVDYQTLTPEGKLVVVVDSHALLYQVFHAMPEMSSPSGLPVGAVHGFLRDVLDLIDKLQPDFMACAFDKGSVTFRNEIYPQYKEHRDPMPDDLRPQVGYVQSILAALNIPVLELENYEADDIMATVAAKTELAGGRCLVVTSDKDCRQLITSQVQLYNTRKAMIYDATDLQVDWGIRPDQVIDFQSLVGDPTDNVPGVPLIGPKLAKQLLNDFETLEGVFANIDSISGAKRKENLTHSQDIAFKSRRLVALDKDVPMEIHWARLRLGGADINQAVQLCEIFGFRQLTARVRRLAQSEIATRPSPRDPAQHTRVLEVLSDAGCETTEPSTPPVNQAEVTLDYRLIDSLDSLKTLAKQLLKYKKISFDTETTSTHPRDARLVGISLAWKAGSAAYIPVQAPGGEIHLELSTVLATLQPLLEHCEIVKIGQNLKYDLLVLQTHGAIVEGTLFDTMVADYLLQPGRNSHGLDELADRYLGLKATSIKELIGTGKQQISMADVPLAKIVPYACQDADFAFRLEEILRSDLESSKLDELFFQVEMPLLRVLAAMEHRGITIDSQRLADFSEFLSQRLDQLQGEIFAEVGESFNIDSPKQLADVLFDKLKLPVIKRTRTGPSTDMEVLTQLAETHSLPQKLIHYRQATKLKGTYADALPKLVLAETGRVHTSFMQDVAATGRLSSKDPNLQNIPIRTEEGRRIRQAFVPGFPTWKLLMADYSQIELRMLAHFCRDKNLCQAFTDDADIHSSVAAEVFQVPLSEVSKEQRRRAKAINFGIIYGQSAFGLAKSLGISREEATTFIEAYFFQYPGVLSFMEKTLQQAREHGFVQTILGRRRPIEGVRPSTSYKNRNMPERIAINTVIQGSAADLIKLAMLRVEQSLETSTLEARLLLQIHDELLFETPSSEIDRLAPLVVQQMTNAYGLSVPLKIDVEVGDNWNDCQDWEESVVE